MPLQIVRQDAEKDVRTDSIVGLVSFSFILETSFEFSFLLQHVCYQSVIPPGRKTIG